MNRIVRSVGMVLALTLSGLALAGDKKQYVVIAPHEPQECLKALDEMVTEKKLEKWSFGCMDGDHTGYLVTGASSKEDALANVPSNLRSKARVVELNKFTPEQVKQFHK
jgi:hypothetical protein